MKKYLILFFFVLYIGTTAFAQGDGITFTDAAWSEILAEAKAENKIIFMDAYTTWCGPCKKMSKEVFPQEAVAELYNTQFVNVKMDMEKGEGVALADRYGVVAYPTLLFIDGDGDLVHRAVGYHSVDQFVELGQTASDPSRTLKGMNARYESGDYGPEFLHQYTFARYDVMDGSHAKIAEEYLNTQGDWKTEDNMTFLFRFLDKAEGKLFDFFVDNRAGFVSLFGPEPVEKKMQYLVYSTVQDSAESSSVEQVEKIYKKVYPEKADKMISDFKMSYYRQANDIDAYADATIAHFKKYPPSAWDEYNEAAWNFYELVDNRKQVKKGLKWAKKSVKMNKNFYNMDTLAALYYKLQKKKCAQETALEAIELAKRSGDDYSETQRLLDYINKL